MNGWSFNPKDSYPTGNSKNHGIHWSLRKVSSLIKLARYRSPWREHTLFFCIPKSKSKRTTFFINTCMRKMSFLLKRHQDRVFSPRLPWFRPKSDQKTRGSMCFYGWVRYIKVYISGFLHGAFEIQIQKNMWIPCKVGPFCQFYLGLFHPYKSPKNMGLNGDISPLKVELLGPLLK